MLKSDALILLVNSLSKIEKRSFKTLGKDSSYMFLFNIIERNKTISSDELRKAFLEGGRGKSFDVAVNYLYKLLLDMLLSLREEQDSDYKLYAKILKAKVLFEKSLFEEALSFLEDVKEEAIRSENYTAHLFASRLELEYLLFINFPNISETGLLNKHFRINETLKIIRKTNEQSSLYELLKYRITYKGNSRSERQKESLNDLVVSEMSMVASAGVESFEIKKLHQLFQSYYLIGVGDYKSALHSYYELNRLFEDNKHLWNNPPYYYLMVIEGILDNLRGIKKYDEMSYFMDQLKKIKHVSVTFQANVNCLSFLYQLFPLIDQGDFVSAKKLIDIGADIFEKLELQSLNRQAELALYTALTHIGLNNYKAAQKALLKVIIRGKNFYVYPLYRTLRLVNLIVQYEIGSHDVIVSETRSIKREISKIKQAYQVEHLMLNFLNRNKSDFLFKREREKTWERLQPRLSKLRDNVFEMQILKLFDFTAWIESKLCKIPLSEILHNRSTDGQQ